MKVLNCNNLAGFDVVQCVPTRKGHQILYKGYTYIFKSEEIPEWVSIYFVAIPEKNVMKCNLCELEIAGNGKSPIFFEHIKENHKDIYDLHKDNPEATVGFRVEFLNINVLKDGDTKVHPIYMDKTCDPVVETEVQKSNIKKKWVWGCATMDIFRSIHCKSDRIPRRSSQGKSRHYKVQEETPQEQIEDVINMQYVMMDTSTKRKYVRKSGQGIAGEQRKRSWIWKYFDKLSNIIYRCNICNVVLSIKGCNTNNLNRHMRSRHPESYKNEKFVEMAAKQENAVDLITPDSEAPHAIITEEIYASNRDVTTNFDSPSQKMRRSWIWSYFEHVSDTQAQCKLCHRQINHGGNATGNMNRHLKMIHHKTSSDNSWVWKVFEKDEASYTCKICQQQLTKNNSEVDMVAILHHLKQEHGVVSGDQIITGSECLEDN